MKYLEKQYLMACAEIDRLKHVEETLRKQQKQNAELLDGLAEESNDLQAEVEKQDKLIRKLEEVKLKLEKDVSRHKDRSDSLSRRCLELNDELGRVRNV
ncbi:hypothetical protein I6N96_09010 [Enterococcus sp. BWM-S5]|uniref:Uncharacterized protein n=1 Tax=Enterococcus larvae TaxID=2794352 RepID=A0ABS4CJG6_9ENTE|nr:hypothetical protein [Enterococcus larvae]MBP1046422.1 hypothetical protein [Enterococcus larvae]